MTRSTHSTRLRTGFTTFDLLGVVVAMTLLVALLLPALASARNGSRGEVALDNLVTLGVAHAVYAADWEGRQVTLIVNEISEFGDDRSSAFQSYNNVHFPEGHPAIIEGWGTVSGQFGEWRYPLSFGWDGNIPLAEPIPLDNFSRNIGAYRIFTARPFHDYVGGRFYDPAFYTPTDPAPYAVAAPAFEDPNEWVGLPNIGQTLGDIPAWSSFCLSPAAMYHPNVFRSAASGGFQGPYSIDEGFQAPGFYQAAFPDLKTHIIEHNWTRNAPSDPCNPFAEHLTYDGCEPYYFNHALDSAPASLMFDLSARFLPNSEVVAADAAVMDKTGEGLWSRDTPLGETGYYGDISFDGTIVSHHILTTGGILGRDTIRGRFPRQGIAPPSVAARRGGRRPGATPPSPRAPEATALLPMAVAE